MRTSIIFIREREEGAMLKLVAGPGKPDEINRQYKEAITDHADRIGEIQLWSSHGGCQKRKTFAAATTVAPKAAQPIPTAPPALPPDGQETSRPDGGNAPGDGVIGEGDDEGPSLLGDADEGKKAKRK
jgi:hypothetical protein